jgi:hypothetical protein
MREDAGYVTNLGKAAGAEDSNPEFFARIHVGG